MPATLSVPDSLRRVPVLAAAGCTAIRGQLTAAPRPARVLGVFPSAVYLSVPAAPAGTGAGDAAGTGAAVLALVSTDSVRLPNALVLAVPAAACTFTPLRPGMEALVGAGRITAGPVVAEARRWWRPAVARPPAGAVALAHGLGRLLAGLAAAPGEYGPGGYPAGLRAATADLVAAAGRADLGAAFAAADRMVGLGPGLTPSGDDVLCGFLVTLRQLGPPGGGLPAFAAALGSLVTSRADRATTALSATLLRHAARGEAAAAVIDLLTALGHDAPLTAPAGAPGGPDGPLPRLLAVGHTSGRDLATGVAAAAQVLTGGAAAERRG